MQGENSLVPGISAPPQPVPSIDENVILRGEGVEEKKPVSQGYKGNSQDSSEACSRQRTAVI
jgi:hypothetical protein